MVKIAPSILSADFARLGQEVAEVKEAGAEWLHFDVLDVHLMIDRPIRYARQFCQAGADLVNFHVEADTEENIKAAIALVKGLGKMTGVTVKPATPAEAVLPFIRDIDLVLVMTVEPGFGGQQFMEDQLDKIRALRQMIDSQGLCCQLEVDGGINPDTAALVREAGATALVAGSAVFGKADRAAAIQALRE